MRKRTFRSGGRACCWDSRPHVKEGMYEYADIALVVRKGGGFPGFAQKSPVYSGGQLPKPKARKENKIGF